MIIAFNCKKHVQCFKYKCLAKYLNLYNYRSVHLFYYQWYYKITLNCCLSVELVGMFNQSPRITIVRLDADVGWERLIFVPSHTQEFYWVKIMTLCGSLKFFNTKLSYPCLYGSSLRSLSLQQTLLSKLRLPKTLITFTGTKWLDNEQLHNEH